MGYKVLSEGYKVLFEGYKVLFFCCFPYYIYISSMFCDVKKKK